jgi:hypothetical protein
MIGMESLEVTTNGRGSDHNPLTGLLPFSMLMGDVALLRVTLLGHGTRGHSIEVSLGNTQAAKTAS